MKQYVIDQLRESDFYRIREYLNENADSTIMEGIYWVNIPEELYTEIQKAHKSCQPFYFAVNLHRRYVGFEWLIRSRNVIRCNCIGYATRIQRDYIIDFADRMLNDLNIKL
ncbi:hypothetical protein [Thermodesulforhabdus norvegica]|uniref:Uncharacterized protein n=1 Tax=Thermodesulforhabdus norvegica TaxID=39841 RepID=A0A1I4RL53_9BACT|nr:hypothetical protein [Thermodesulforhabdus norvegica]SFM52987.1 hypothetical protein SAMN05660836_00679 [Thermodesulforhabdus norvegica]